MVYASRYRWRRVEYRSRWAEVRWVAGALSQLDHSRHVSRRHLNRVGIGQRRPKIGRRRDSVADLMPIFKLKRLNCIHRMRVFPGHVHAPTMGRTQPMGETCGFATRCCVHVTTFSYSAGDRKAAVIWSGRVAGDGGLAVAGRGRTQPDVCHRVTTACGRSNLGGRRPGPTPR